MSEKPYISIVTPVWNAAATVRRTLDALSRQQASFEHVVYDGGSTDGTPDIVREYLGRYPMRLMQGENLGVYGNVANGHRTTSGEIMGWINGDDFYLPFTLAMVEEVFRSRPDIEWLTGVPTLHWEGRQLWSLPGYVPIYPRMLIRGGWYRAKRLGCLQQESMFWRRSLYERTGGEAVLRKYRWAGDFHLWRTFAAHTRLHTIATPLAAFTFRDGQFSAANKVEYDAECGTGPNALDMSKLGSLFNRAYSQLLFRTPLKPIRYVRRGHW